MKKRILSLCLSAAIALSMTGRLADSACNAADVFDMPCDCPCVLNMSCDHHVSSLNVTASFTTKWSGKTIS